MAETKTSEPSGTPPQQALSVAAPNAVVTAEQLSPEEELQKFLFYGDLSSLSIKQQNEYIFRLAKSMSLNPWTRPFDMLVLNGKMTVYTNKGAAAQLRDIKHITLKKVYAGALRLGDGIPPNPAVFEVEIEASIPDEHAEGGWRRGSNVGTVPIQDLRGEALSNAVLKCWTKAERRATLSIAGIAFPDETEVDTIAAREEKRDEPQKRTPRSLPQTVRAPEVQPGTAQAENKATTTVVGGEKVDTKTGEIVDAETVTPAATPQAQTAPTPAASLPPRGKFPPAVAPAGLK